ncbi:hypothetical protein JD844_020186 [Phrynosoma platyrhinos]|uniref:unspecific monooxygenase n=1 Tax=Phrynosoma platyrhinos TaxID=52577 RepID=A0ABQ7SS85_PHRPL|nr:hypothetical protein JD844_020186 [Phrynosoma platyrhinos]
MEPLGTTTVLLILCISCLLLSAIWKSRTWRKGKLPPGPTPLPIIGNALQVKTNYLDQTLCKLSEKYGPVFTLYLGVERVVILHGYEAIKEALIDRAEEFAARGKLHIGDIARKGQGIIFSNGERWKQLRRFALTTLRNFGMGKKSIEERIQDEAQYLLEKLQDTKGRKLLSTSSTLVGFVSCLSRTTLRQLSNSFPSFMSFIPGPHQRIVPNTMKTNDFILEEAKEHRATLDPSSPRDFIDCFYIKMDQEEHNGASEFTIENLIISTFDLFIAGTETTSTTLKFGLLILQKYPEIEEKVQEEIDRVVGRSRRPCMADRAQMPYTDAVIHEIQRFISLVPLSVPHAVVRDTPFRQYVIPKGTTIYPVLTSVLHDSKEFPNPKEFDPRHFLNEDGTFRKSDYFMPFSAGKRICAGEGLARMELFLFLTSILQNFKLKALVDPKEIDITPLMSSSTVIPRPYRLCVVPR